MSNVDQKWLSIGKGRIPSQRWAFTTDAPLIDLRLARETGEVLAVDASGGLHLLDRNGQIVLLSRSFQDATALSWSDTGNSGCVVVRESKLTFFSQSLEVKWSLNLRDTILATAIDSFGNYVCATLASGTNYVIDSQKQRVARFETIRPLSFLEFLIDEPTILAAAEYGQLCSHQLDGRENWNEKMWSNVGDMSVTGDGKTIYLAGFNHGVQTFDEDGAKQGSYLVEGTPNHVSSSFQQGRIAISTLERHLYWLDSNGEILWVAVAADDICGVCCDPLGTGMICGFSSGRIIRLDWKDSADQ